MQTLFGERFRILYLSVLDIQPIAHISAAFESLTKRQLVPPAPSNVWGAVGVCPCGYELRRAPRLRGWKA
jgi:hypothetical protein